jgi:hypothetical protein
MLVVINKVLVERVEEQCERCQNPNKMLSLDLEPSELAAFDLVDVLVDCQDVIQTTDQMMLLGDKGRDLMERDRERRQ